MTRPHFVMLNLVEHPWSIAGRSRVASVAPWTLKRIRGDDPTGRRA